MYIIYVWGHVKMCVPPKLWCRKKLLPRNRPSQGVLLITHQPQLATTSLLLGGFTCLDSGSNYDEPSLTTINMLLNSYAGMHKIWWNMTETKQWNKYNVIYIYIIDIYNHKIIQYNDNIRCICCIMLYAPFISKEKRHITISWWAGPCSCAHGVQPATEIQVQLCCTATAAAGTWETQLDNWGMGWGGTNNFRWDFWIFQHIEKL